MHVLRPVHGTRLIFPLTGSSGGLDFQPANQGAIFAIEPQFNLPDPYNRNWGNAGNGMVLLQPGQSVSWRVRLELFAPKE